MATVNSGSARLCGRSAFIQAHGAIPGRGLTPISIFAHIKRLIQKLESGKFDAFFMADHLAVLNMPISALKRSHTVTSFEPFTLLSALAGATEHIGLIATGSTTIRRALSCRAPFCLARSHQRRARGLEHVTTSNPDAR